MPLQSFAKLKSPLKRVLANRLTTEGASDSLHAGRMVKLSGYRIWWMINSEGIYLLTERTAIPVVRFFILEIYSLKE